MNVLVTGAQGFTGRFFISELLGAEPGAHVIGIGRSRESEDMFTHPVTWNARALTAPLVADLRVRSPRYRYVACDLADRDALARLLRDGDVDVVVHLAAALRDSPVEALVGTNIAGTIALFAAIASLERKPRVVLGSSGSVYGPGAGVPTAESERCAPNESYAMSKLAAEYAARIASHEARVATCYARIFNIAGPGQDERHVCGRFAAQVAAIAEGIAPPRIELGDLRPTRDFVDVRDVATALRFVAQRGTPGETYNVASGRETSIETVLQLSLEAAQIADRVELVERYARPSDLPRQCADIEKLAALGFAPAFSLPETVRDLVAYYRGPVAAAAGSAASKSRSSAPETGLPSSQG